ncbi:YlbF family regulator [Desulfosporosinus sp.]|uniref:YlbF family regulator n=1 Tax=Desulfosporosinus sp. TaxID=157907 RepID=UPI002319C7B2|nr:YlbF family regulator [Desulfosporosinus sp.]MCO5385566.1 YlbF family regulator [Desulfosporosinus sp.]MDA8223870.1 YlbF family regulator [Desulfitobacterium hafniense]
MATTDLAHELAHTLKESDQFKQFLKSKEKVMSDANNHKMVREFQLKQWEIREAQMLEQEVSEEKQQELERLYSLVSINPTAREYLEAEFEVSCMVNDIQKIIGEAIQDAMPIGFEEINP